MFAEVVQTVAKQASDYQSPEVMVVEANGFAFVGLEQDVNEDYLLLDLDE